MAKTDAIGYALKNVIVPGMEDRRKRREEFQQRIEAALINRALSGEEQGQSVFQERDGQLTSLGQVPKGSQILRDPNSSPLDQLRQAVMQNTAAMQGPGIMEGQMNQMAPEQLGSMDVQQQYGQSVLGMQNAQARQPMIQQQAQQLQGMGLMGSRGAGGAFSILNQQPQQPLLEQQQNAPGTIVEKNGKHYRVVGVDPLTGERMLEGPLD